MPQVFKDGISAANSMMPKNLKDSELEALWNQFGSRDISEMNFLNDVNEYANQIAKIKGISPQDAQILVHGALSRPGSQRGSLVGRSIGIFDSELAGPGFDGQALGDKYLKENPNAWGVLYGYNAGGKKYRLKNPIYVNDQEEINKYQNALGSNGKGETSAWMEGRYR